MKFTLLKRNPKQQFRLITIKLFSWFNLQLIEMSQKLPISIPLIDFPDFLGHFRCLRPNFYAYLTILKKNIF